MKKLPINNIGWPIVIYCLVLNCITHAYSMIIDYGGWDFTVAEIFMVQTVHLSFLAWDYSDAANLPGKNPKELKQIPTLLEHIAAGLCPSQCMGGPAGHMIDFLDFIYARNDYVVLVNSTWPTLKKIMTATAWTFIYLIIIHRYPVSLLYTDYSAQPFQNRVFLC